MKQLLLSVIVAGLIAVAAASARSQSLGPVPCNLNAQYDTNTNGATQLVAAPGAKGKIWICSYALGTGGSATNISLVSGTGTNCATNQATLTPAWELAANQTFVETSANILVPDSTALCIKTSAGNAVQGRVTYAIVN